MATELTWTDTDRLAVDTARVLAADAVEKTGNGHPGTAISLAPLGYLLYHKVMSIDPSDPNWLGRDRFIMSAVHPVIPSRAGTRAVRPGVPAYLGIPDPRPP